MFHVGQLVVCVDDGKNRMGPQNRRHVLHGLKKGIVYTIRWVGMSPDHGLYLCVRVVEITRPIYLHLNEEIPFCAARFRPVVETRLDVFREMLAPVPGVKQKECV